MQSSERPRVGNRHGEAEGGEGGFGEGGGNVRHGFPDDEEDVLEG